jgi:rsbT co-antagonist protein RsbR
MSPSPSGPLVDGRAADLAALQARIDELERQLAAHAQLAAPPAADDASALRLQVTLAVTGAGCFDLDLTTGALWLSDEYLAIIGYAPGEHQFTFEEWMALGHPDDAAVVLPLAEACLSGQAPSYQMESRLRRKDGSWVWAYGQGRVVARGADGRATRLIGTISDRTAQKQAEEAARASAATNEAILAAIPGLIFILSNDGDYLDYRTDDENLLLAPAGSFLGKNIREVLPAMAEPFLALLQAARATGQVQDWAFPAEGPDGTRYFEGQVAPIGPDRVLMLTREVTDRKRLEVERERLQEEVIQAQAAALAELSTPLIPLNADVVVMPLVGTLDSRRAQQVLETLLDGISSSRAGTAIIDITGVPLVDTQVANALIRAAQAVKLLGAQVVLTGIRPEVAQTLVGLGADLSSITTRGSLQAGIAFAMRRA